MQNYPYGVVPPHTKKFTELDLSLSEALFSLQHPVYVNLTKGLKFIERTIRPLSAIDTSDVDLAGKTNGAYTQSARSTGRGQYAADVHASIEQQGYKLDKEPISVVICPDKKEHACNGRTRLEKLQQLGFENVIVDVFEAETWNAFHVHSLKTNQYADPYSPFLAQDLEQYALKAWRSGDLKRTFEGVYEAVKEIGGTSFKDKTYHNIASNVVGFHDRDLQLFAHTDATAKEWLNNNGYINNLNNNQIYYYPYASSSWSKCFVNAASFYNELISSGKPVKEIRVVVQTGTLNGADGEQCWKNRIDRFRRNWAEVYNLIEKTHFINSERKSVIKLYGAIPAVASIADEWPLDKLVLFNKGKLANNYFQDLDDDNNLSDFLEDAA